MGLFTPAWKSDDVYKRKMFLRRTKDMDRVREMALHDPESYVRYEAVYRIDEKAFLLLSLKNEAENHPSENSTMIEYLAKKIGSDEAFFIAYCGIQKLGEDKERNTMVHRIKDKLSLLPFIKLGVAELYQRAAVAVIGYELLKDMPLVQIGDAAAQELDTLRKRQEQVQMRKERERIEREKQEYELLHCPDGSLHEFSEELIEQYDKGYRDDDEMKAREYGTRTYRLCQKCGYRKYRD